MCSVMLAHSFFIFYPSHKGNHEIERLFFIIIKNSVTIKEKRQSLILKNMLSKIVKRGGVNEYEKSQMDIYYQC